VKSLARTFLLTEFVSFEAVRTVLVFVLSTVIAGANAYIDDCKGLREEMPWEY
jgi:hypothetical protein